MDRLGELKKSLLDNSQFEVESDQVNLLQNHSVHSPMTTSRSSEYHDPAMADFYNTVDRIKDQINSLSNIAKELKDMENSELKVTSDVNQLKAFREAVVNRVDKASLISVSVKEQLTRVREQNNNIRNSNISNANLRVRENLVNTLTRKFVEVVKELQAIQTSTQDAHKKTTMRITMIASSDIDNEKAEQLYANDADVKGLVGNYFNSTDSRVQKSYIDQQMMQNFAVKLEKSVNELHQLFMDFAMIVEQQGVLLDVIEHQVKSANDFIEEANKEMVEVITLQKSIRKRQFFICIFVILVLAIIGVVVAKFLNAF